MAKKKLLLPEWRCRWLGALAGAKSGTVFLVGNGPSKKLADIDALATKGIIFGCNKAFKEHRVDFLGFMDSRVLEECLHFPGPKFIPWRQYYENERALLKQHNNRNLWFYRPHKWGWPEPEGRWPQDHDPSEIYDGLTGFLIAQAALILGFRRLVFVGFDCAGPEGTDCNVIESLKQERGKLERFLPYAQGKGAELYILDGHGTLDYPIVSYAEVMKWMDLSY